MATFDRSQFKKKVDAFDDSAVSSYTNSNQRIGYHEIKAGPNWFRFYPDPHGGAFLTPKVVSWLPQEVEEEDSKTHKKKTVIKRLPILNSKVHFKTKKDLVEEYIAFLRAMLIEECPNEEERKARLFPIEGDAKSYLTSPLPRASWIAYADKYTKDAVNFGRVEIGAAIKGKMREQQEGQESPEDVAGGIDIFSDPDVGRRVNIQSFPDEKKPNDKYKVSIDLNKVTVLDDDTLEEHLKRESIADTLKFKPSDFHKQLNGLKLFDDEHGFGVFADDKWLAICEEISEYYPKEDDDKSEAEKPGKSETIKKPLNKTTNSATKVNKRVEQEVEEEIEESIDSDYTGELDKFNDMDRTELKIYNRDNKLGIVVTGKMSDDNIRDAIRKVEAANSASMEEEQEEEIEEVIEEEKPTKKSEPAKKVTTTKTDTKSRIDKIREKTAGDKKK